MDNSVINHQIECYAFLCTRVQGLWLDKNVPCNATRKFTRITRMELIFNARQPSRCPELPAGHGNYAYWQKSTASSSEQRRNPCLQDGKALEGLQARPDPVYEPMSVSLIFRLGQKESRWTPQPESSGIRFYRIHHKCNAQQYHQKFFHTLFSFCLMIPSLFCLHYTDLAGQYGCPSYTCHKKRNAAFSFWMYRVPMDTDFLFGQRHQILVDAL